MICDIRATNKSGEYQKCEQEATRVSRFGWFNCEEHCSVADLKLEEIGNQDLLRIIALRPDHDTLRLTKEEIEILSISAESDSVEQTSDTKE